jgi:N,N'-diacetyllegionaminate synthase
MSKVIIIAEAGVNHNGDLDIAKKLIDVAAESGSDFVKFQTFQADKLVGKSARMADYQKLNLGGGYDSQYDMLSRLQLSEEMHYELKDHAEKNGIRFLSTAFDHDSIQLLKRIGLDLYKIPSGEITNYPYLVELALEKKPIILSTGMATLAEVQAAFDVLIEHGVTNEMVTILHCNTEYPTPFQDVNLRAMIDMGKALGVNFGYSDHTLGIEVPIAAVALGACVIEKHFTLDRKLKGPDHAASLEPAELKAMVTAIRNIELALSGSGVKEPSESERKNIDVARKSIFVKRRLVPGHVIQSDDLIMLRPGNGISPMEFRNVVGKTLAMNIEEGTMLKWEHVL